MGVNNILDIISLESIKSMKTIRTTILFILFFGVIFINVNRSQTVLNVPQQYASIQSALNASTDFDTVKVSPGIYEENLSWPIGVDPLVLLSSDGPVNTTIKGKDSLNVIHIDNWPSSNGNIISSNSLIKGFTITQEKEAFGRGIYLNNGNMHFDDLIITDCNKGGMRLYRYEGDIENCQIINNETLDGNGAGVDLRISGNVNFTNCQIDGNKINWTGGGAGIYVQEQTNGDSNQVVLSFELCSISDNRIVPPISSGAGLKVEFYESEDLLKIDIKNSVIAKNRIGFNAESGTGSGGGIDIWNASLRLIDSQVEYNEAGKGSGIALDISEPNKHHHFIKNSFISFNSSFFTNTAGPDVARGLAIYARDSVGLLELENCVISNNQLGTVFDLQHVDLKMTHCTMANNDGKFRLQNGSLDATNSIFWHREETENAFWFSNSISTTEACIISPSPNNCDFRDTILMIPAHHSFAIENATIQTDIENDIFGNPRPLPANTTPDIGAYELDQSTSSNQEIDKDLDFMLYPNPTNGICQFSKLVDQVQVFDSLGKPLLSQQNCSFINLANFPVGLYFIRLAKGKSSSTRSIVKN